VIHSTALIGPNVILGNNVRIGAYTVVEGNVIIEDNVQISSHVVIGTAAEHRTIPTNPNGRVVIKSGTIIREFVMINSPLYELTQVGTDCYLMGHVHVSHDSIIGNHVTLAPSSTLAGHCKLGDYANFGLGASAHQSSSIGGVSMVGMGAVVTKDLPPFLTYTGVPATAKKINAFGLKRVGMEQGIPEILKFYQEILTGKKMQDALMGFNSLPLKNLVTSFLNTRSEKRHLVNLQTLDLG
jgi:UDP-N-acetylglucosamine acyltransferase